MCDQHVWKRRVCKKRRRKKAKNKNEANILMLRLTDSSRRIKLQEKCVGYTITTVVLRYSMTTKVKKESTMYLMKF